MDAVLNRTGEYLRLHAEIETEGARVPPAQFDAAVDEAVRALTVSADTPVADIARMCAWFSTPQREVYARIECVGGKPVVYFGRSDHSGVIPGFLRRQAD